MTNNNIEVKYCRKYQNRVCALSKGGEECLAQQGIRNKCDLQMGSGYISLGKEDEEGDDTV